MSIFPRGDLILDVMQAADPKRSAVVIEKLKTNDLLRFEKFHDVIATKSSKLKSVQRPAEFSPKSYLEGGLTTHRERRAASSSSSSIKKLESLLLKQVIEELMPKNVLGFGQAKTSNSVWRSMLAEKIADAISDQTSLGIRGKADSHTAKIT